MGAIIAIDPGADTGYAYLSEGRLIDARLVDYPDVTVCPVLPPYSADVVTVERPRWYAHESKVDANDLIVLSLRAGALGRAANGRVRYVEPAQWKGGQVPKTIMHHRILAALGAPEREIVDKIKCSTAKRHNVLDAIGIGLYQAGRL